MKKIYILHEYGSNSHYNGLLALCNDNGITPIYREFRFLHLVGSGTIHKNAKRVFKQVVNFLFLINLVCTRGKTIVLGMHPYDRRLPILAFILRRHKVYYHTSFTMWNPAETVKYRNVSSSQKRRLENFLTNQVRHIFAVTQKAKNSILANTHYPAEKISVVYHSYFAKLKTSNVLPPPTLICMSVEWTGIRVSRKSVNILQFILIEKSVW